MQNAIVTVHKKGQATQRSLGEMQNAIVTVHTQGQATKSQDMNTINFFRCKSWMRARTQVMQRVVGSTAFRCLCSFPPDAAAMSMLNATQLQLMVWLLRFAKKGTESWVEFCQSLSRSPQKSLIRQHNIGALITIYYNYNKIPRDSIGKFLGS